MTRKMAGDSRWEELLELPLTQSALLQAAVDLSQEGEIRVKQRGFGKANIIKLADQLLLLDENGVLALARLTDDRFEILGKAQVLSGRCWTAPTVVGDTIYLRDRTQIKAIRLG